MQEQEVSVENKLTDLEGDSYSELGYLLLQEGQLWEAEECHAIGYSKFQSFSDMSESHRESEWILSAISAGAKLWPRFAGLCREDVRIPPYNI